MNYTEKTEVRELFDMYDLDDSGSICRNELKLIMQSLGFTITDGNVTFYAFIWPKFQKFVKHGCKNMTKMEMK